MPMIPPIEVNFLIRYFESRPSDRVDHDQNRRRPSLPGCGKHWRRKPTVKQCQKKRALACFQGRWPTLNQSVAWFDFGTISLCTFLRTSPEPFPHCSVVGRGPVTSGWILTLGARV